jgi:rhodanese-related sulfurtransferase
MNFSIEEVNPAMAFERIQNGALLLDIREWEEIEMFNFDVEDQLMIPLSEFTGRFHEIPVDREIIVGCNSGNRSMQAVFFLRSQNFERVYNLQGGINDWIQTGLPVQWDHFKAENVLRKDAITDK